MKLTLKLLDTSKEIQQKILNAMLPEITATMNSGITKIKSQLPDIIRQAIINSPEYNSLLNGQLRYEFGIDNSSSKLASLLEVWSTNIQYSYTKPHIVGVKIKSAFSANTIRADFSDVLYTDYAVVTDMLRGYSLPWLEWLLLEGNKTIINNYEVVFGPNSSSRTGYAVMHQSRRSWQVPSEFAGTMSDNWITRAIDNIGDEIENMLNGVLS